MKCVMDNQLQFIVQIISQNNQIKQRIQNQSNGWQKIQFKLQLQYTETIYDNAIQKSSTITHFKFINPILLQIYNIPSKFSNSTTLLIFFPNILQYNIIINQLKKIALFHNPIQTKLMSQNDFQSPYSTDNIIKNYKLLSSDDSEQREAANRYLLTLADQEETWITCQSMIESANDPNFVFLGAQLLYQKIEKDLHHFNPSFRTALKNFLFHELDSAKHTKIYIIDKLASSAALIVSTMILSQWVDFFQNLTEFMKKSRNHLLSGLIILQRIPQEVRMTNRIAQGIKSRIQEKLLEKQQKFSFIISQIFDLQDQECIIRVLKAAQSWIRICFPLMKYPELVSKILQKSTINLEMLEMCIKIICEAVKLVSSQKSPGLSQIDPIKQQQTYTHQQITSIQSIITFIFGHKKNFLAFNVVEVEYTQIYLQLVKELLLSFGFLVLQSVGFELLSIVLQITATTDRKLSASTFQFWIDYAQKIGKFNSFNNQIKLKLYETIINLFQILSVKLLITNDTLMIDADLKEDDTVDDADGITFSQYRQDAVGVLGAIYDYLVKVNKEKGAQIYFKKVVHLLQSDSPPLTRYTQLALFLLKSPLESMINQTTHITEILSYLITQINSHTIKNLPIAPIVLGETMNFIRDCTREIKQKDQLFLQALRLVLNYINDEKLCHHAAYCFQILMETINTLNEPMIAESLIEFYSSRKFTKQVILEKMLQGIFNAIIKLPDQNKVNQYLESILNRLFKKYQQCPKVLTFQEDQHSELYLSLLEIKTLLDSYDSCSSAFKSIYKKKFVVLANKGIEIVNQVLPLGIQNKLKFSTINQIGISIAIYRVSLKIIETPEGFQIGNDGVPNFICSLSIVNMILNNNNIAEYFYVITILSETLVQFINHDSVYLNLWLQNNLGYFCAFFAIYYQSPQQKIDPDIMKQFFTVLQSLLLYNKNIFDQYEQKESVLSIVLSSIKHLNQRNMQRKAISLVYLGLENDVWANNNFESMFQSLFVSIPIVHSIGYTNLAKIFIKLFKNTTLESKQNVFFAMLGLEPYNQLEQNIRTLLAKAIAMGLTTQEERNIKTIFNQLNEIVWKKMSSDIVMQLQLKIATWKRQLKKLQQQINNPTVQHQM